MRLPRLRPRLRLRTLLIAVAVVAVVLGSAVVLWKRHNRYRALADRYGSPIAHLRLGSILTTEQRWRYTMWRKYDHAARYPWLSVAPDPPPPE